MHKFLLPSFLMICTGCAGQVAPSSNNNEAIVNPACNYQVRKHDSNAWLLTQPEIHFVYWGSDWDYYSRTEEVSTWTYLIDNVHVLSRLSEYGIQNGFLDTSDYNLNLSLSGSDPHSAGATIDDSVLATELNHEIQTGDLPYPTSDSLYVVRLPPGVLTTRIRTGSLLGYHRMGVYGTVKYAFAVVPHFDNTDQAAETISHELYEAITDPDVGTGFYGKNTEQEIGDLCNQVKEFVGGDAVQKVWSETLCDCL